MKNTLIALALATTLVACNKKSASVSASTSDAVEQKLTELAGKDAKNCGRVKSVSENEVKPASDCAMQSAKDKKPFYVAYDMPGLTVALAGAADGKLYSVQSQSPAPAGGQQQNAPAGPAQVSVTPCPAELRVASSGRVTCFSTGSFGVSTNGQSPHGGGGMMSPHGGGMSMPPAGTPNPHGSMMGSSTDMPSAHGSATKNDKSAQKGASKQ